ncbi:MAG: helix-turn-helix domain-containing protein [Bacillota bacterium]
MARRPTLLQALQDLGLNQTEAKVYLALLWGSPANGNQISRASGVPSAKVYEQLERLKEMGLVAPVGMGGEFVPLPFEDLLRQRKARLEEAGELLRRHAARSIQRFTGDVLWQERGYGSLLEKAGELIRSAQDEVLLSLWLNELARLKGAVFDALDGGAHVSAIVFCSSDEARAMVGDATPRQLERLHLFPHASLPTVYLRHANQAALVVDGLVAMLMDGSGPEGWIGVWSGNRAVVTLVTNYIRHDIYVNKIYADFGDQLRPAYGQYFEKLLNIRQGSLLDRIRDEVSVKGGPR